MSLKDRFDKFIDYFTEDGEDASVQTPEVPPRVSNQSTPTKERLVHTASSSSQSSTKSGANENITRLHARQQELAQHRTISDDKVTINVRYPRKYEETTEIVRGKPKKIYRKLFPAYVMLEMEATREENENGISYKVDPDVWYIIRNTNGVTGFVGVGSDPIPMEDDEVKNIFNIIGMDTSKETIKLDFAEGDFVKILKGSFIDQEGQVAEIDYEHGRVKVMVDIFGRMTPVEIEVDGVLKV